jgi:hypothetical protein
MERFEKTRNQIAILPASTTSIIGVQPIEMPLISIKQQK